MGKIDYNCGKWPHVVEEWPDVSVLCKDDAGEVFHTYSTYGRGVDVTMETYRMLDLTPNGRRERDDKMSKMEWMHHDDRYETTPVAKSASAEASCCKGPK